MAYALGSRAELPALFSSIFRAGYVVTIPRAGLRSIAAAALRAKTRPVATNVDFGFLDRRLAPAAAMPEGALAAARLAARLAWRQLCGLE
jgi:hypothetical protein